MNIHELGEQLTMWGGYIGIAIFGILYFAGMFDLRLRKRRGEENQAEDRLINLLKDEVNELTKRVNGQAESIRTLNAQVTELQATNVTLRDILQGRDTASLEYQRQVLEAIKVGEETNQYAKAASEGIANLARLIEQHLKNIEISLQSK